MGFLSKLFKKKENPKAEEPPWTAFSLHGIPTCFDKQDYGYLTFFKCKKCGFLIAYSWQYDSWYEKSGAIAYHDERCTRTKK